MCGDLRCIPEGCRLVNINLCLSQTITTKEAIMTVWPINLRVVSQRGRVQVRVRSIPVQCDMNPGQSAKFRSLQVSILKSCMVTIKIEIMPFLYNAAPISWTFTDKKKEIWLPFLYNAAVIPGHLLQNKHLTSSLGNVIVQDSCHIVQE